jgi:imidazolonepropionase-like amidohydrolase
MAIMFEGLRPSDYQLSRKRPSDYQLSRRWFRASLKVVRRAQQAGVKLLAGSDAPFAPYCFHGYSLHDELSLFVQAGLTPQEAIQTATRNAAEFLGRKTRGTIRVGNNADLLVLERDPFQDIRNTRRIRAVVVDGKLLERAQLELLASRTLR